MLPSTSNIRDTSGGVKTLTVGSWIVLFSISFRSRMVGRLGSTYFLEAVDCTNGGPEYPSGMGSLGQSSGGRLFLLQSVGGSRGGGGGASCGLVDCSGAGTSVGTSSVGIGCV